MSYEHVHSHPSLLRQTFPPHKYLPDLHVRTILLKHLCLLVMLIFYCLWVFFTYYYFCLLLFWDSISHSPELPQIRYAAEDDLEVLTRCRDWCAPPCLALLLLLMWVIYYLPMLPLLLFSTNQKICCSMVSVAYILYCDCKYWQVILSAGLGYLCILVHLTLTLMQL